MPWKTSYSREDAEVALRTSKSWADALRFLGVAPRGKNFSTLKKWAAVWELPTSHLPSSAPRSRGPAFTELQAREAIAASRSWSEALGRLNYCKSGSNPRTLKKWVERWRISTEHFDARAASIDALNGSRRKIPLEEILVENSTYARGKLKKRLYAAGLKKPICELCGQGDLARSADQSDSRSHQRGSGRQPHREPSDRLSKLRRWPRHSLRPQA